MRKFSLIVTVMLAACPSKQEAQRELDDISNHVAQDTVKQYDIAKRNGNKMDACVNAGMVAAAYLQAKNETEYKKWKAIESADCKAAGLPDMK